MTFVVKIIFLYCAMVLIRPQEFMPWLNGLPVMPLLLIISIIVWVFSGAKTPFNHLHLLFLLIVYVLILHIVWVGFNGLSDTLLGLAAIFVIYGIISTSVTNTESIHAFLYLYVFAAIVMAWHGVLQIHVGSTWTGINAIEEGVNLRIRYIGIFQDPNDLGMILASSVPIVWYFFQNNKALIYRVVSLLSLILILYAVSLTNSRGTTLSLVVLVLYLLKNHFGLLKSVIFSLPILSIVLLLNTRMATVNTEDESAAGRLDAWIEGINMLYYSKFIGVGMGQFTEYHFRTAHNSYVLAMAELGVIGYFLWICVILSPFYIMLKMAKNYKMELGNKYALASALINAQIIVFTSSFFLSRTFLIPLFIISSLSLGFIHGVHKDGSICDSKKMLKISLLNWFFISLFSIVLLYVLLKIIV